MDLKGFNVFQTILFIILINVLETKAACNVCSFTTQMACVSETDYQFCVGGVPTGAITSCPTGYVCSTSTNTICLQNVAGVEATCNDCNTCDPNLIFACTSVNTYALCLGTTTPSSSGGTCATGQVCSIDNPQICGTSPPEAATCPTANIVSTTTSAPTITFTPPTTVPTYAQYFCQTMQVNTRFQMPTNLDNTCRRYIYCFRTRQGVWSGQIYTCAGSTYFDPRSKYCVAQRPSTC